MTNEEVLLERLKEAREKTGVATNAKLARYISDREGYAIPHARFTAWIRHDPVWVAKLLHDEILSPSSLRIYPQRPRCRPPGEMGDLP